MAINLAVEKAISHILTTMVPGWNYHQFGERLSKYNQSTHLFNGASDADILEASVFVLTQGLPDLTDTQYNALIHHVREGFFGSQPDIFINNVLSVQFVRQTEMEENRHYVPCTVLKIFLKDNAWHYVVKDNHNAIVGVATDPNKTDLFGKVKGRLLCNHWIGYGPLMQGRTQHGLSSKGPAIQYLLDTLADARYSLT